MNTQHNMEERLWEYIDGYASGEERSVIEKLLQTDGEWKEKYSELLEINKLISSAEMESPSLRFGKNVMEEISRLHIAPATKTYINKKIIWGISFFFIAMLTSILIYGFTQMSLSAGEETNLSRNFNKVDFSKFFNNTWINVLMMVNVLIGLVLLDFYLNNKRKQFRKEA
jgi:hypothetical protein